MARQPQMHRGPETFKGAAAKTPKGWSQIYAVTTASAVDLHGQDPTVRRILSAVHTGLS